MLEQVDNLRNEASEPVELIDHCWPQWCNLVSELAGGVDDHTEIRERLCELLESHG
jgi:hypothetical protein